MDMRSYRRHPYVAVRDQHGRYAYNLKYDTVQGMLNRGKFIR